MMTMTLKDNIVNPVVPPMNYHTFSTFGHDYHHHNPWEKPNYATFGYPPTPYTMGTMSSSSGATSKASDSHPSFATPSNLQHNSTSNFYRRHTESVLPTSTTTHHPSSNPFHYSHTPAHYHPSGLFFGWHNGPSLMRTHSASHRDYLQSSAFPRYSSMSSSTSQPTTHTKSADIWSAAQLSTRPIHAPVNPDYPSFFNPIPPLHFPLPSLPPTATVVPSKSKRSMSSRKKRSRMTAQVRYEILKLKANKPTVFVWEIQQTLLQNGICTGQTLPHATVIQHVLNEPSISINIVKDEPIPHTDLPVPKRLDNLEHHASSSMTICLSPSQSDGESASECSICLETYRSGQEVSILSCSHEYHSSCIKEWMIKNRSCPMCRKDIHNQPQFVTLLI